MSQHVDTLITHAHLFSMQGDGVGYIADGALAVKDRLIEAVGTTEELEARFHADEIIEAIDCAVLPGLIDAHMHTSLAILRGVAQDVAHWMQSALSPYSRQVTTDAAMAGTRLGVVEALKAGTCTFVDNTRPFPGWGEFYVESGVRAVLSPGFNALPSGKMADWKVGDLYHFDLEAGRSAMEKAVAFTQDWDGAAEGRITTMLGVQAADMLPVEMLKEAKEVAARSGWMLHVHVAQGDRETEQILKRYGKRPIALLDEIGYLDEQLLAIHLTDATEEEAELAAQRGAHMVVCSGSIGIIDGIVPPARVFRQAGGVVGLGSDQACGNNCINIFNEMKLTALFNKIKYADPRVMPAWEVLRMATIEGARAIGLGDRIGSLEAGKEADLILVDLKSANLSPVLLDPIRNIVPNLVYAGS
ncbi:MAG: amidohydrolase family protein, partial [Anaerolineaceae bacterium]|nr:amidohydrolase family protein [Anaerolineaceae bacterium]